MSIYIINPSFIMKNHSKAHCFVKELKEQFDKGNAEQKHS